MTRCDAPKPRIFTKIESASLKLVRPKLNGKQAKNTCFSWIVHVNQSNKTPKNEETGKNYEKSVH